jgi:hypothetical protein
MNEKEVMESLQEADRALDLAVARIKELEDLLAFYANPQSWERCSFRLATTIPTDTDTVVGYDFGNKTHFFIGGAKARSYFNGVR